MDAVKGSVRESTKVSAINDAFAELKSSAMILQKLHNELNSDRPSAENKTTEAESPPESVVSLLNRLPGMLNDVRETISSTHIAIREDLING